MRAGLLNEIIKIYKIETTKDKLGFEQSQEVLRYTTRARIEHKSGNRANENGEIVYSNMDTFIVRMYVPIENTDIIEWDGRKYRVLYISPNKQRQEIKIDVELINE